MGLQVLIECREYEIHIGKIEDFAELYRNEGLPILLRYMNEPIGFFSAITGDCSRFIHMWPYRDFEEREKKRGLLQQDPDWISYISESRSYIKSMNIRFVESLDSDAKSLVGRIN